jgi:hypothetical protein
MGKASRAKGRRGESEALLLFQERGFTLSDCTAGKSTEDHFGLDPNGHAVSIEVKNRVTWNIPEFRKQARENARKRGKRVHWVIALRVPNHTGVWYVEGTNLRPTIWRANVCRVVA